MSALKQRTSTIKGTSQFDLHAYLTLPKCKKTENVVITLTVGLECVALFITEHAISDTLKCSVLLFFSLLLSVTG